MSKAGYLWLVLATLALVSALGFAKADQLVGRVTDSAGKPLPGVLITLQSSDGKSYVGGTDDQGVYRFETLPVGRYQLHTELFGFRPFEKADIEISAQSQAAVQLDISLSMSRRDAGAAGTTVKPSATAPAATAPAKSAASGTPTKAAPPNRQPAPAQAVNRPFGRGGYFPGRGMPPGQNQPFQNVTLQNTAEATDVSAPAMSAANPSESLGTQDNPASVIPSEAFLINGSINFGVQGAPQGPGGDFMSDPRFQMIRERLGIMEPGQPGEGFFQGGIQGGMAQMGGPGGGRGGAPGGGGGGPGGRGGMMGGPGMGGGRGGFANRMNRPQGMVNFSLRNSAFDARPYSLTGVEQKKQSYANERFGATLGGPLKIFRWKKSQQAPFYMINYSGQRGNSGFDATSSVPLVEERQGNFSASLLRSGAAVQLYDPLSPIGQRTPFPNNVIPATRLDPAAVALLKYLPLPNQPEQVQNYFFQQSLPTSNDQISIRLNGRIRQRDNINVSYSFNRSKRLSGNAFPELESSAGSRGQNFQLGMNHMFQRGISNQFQFSFNRNRNLTSNAFSYANDVIGRLGILGLSRDPINYGIPTISFTNYGDLRLSNPSQRVQQTLGLTDSFRFLKGKHSLSMGFEFRHVTSNRFVDENGRGTFDFTGFTTSNFDSNGNPIAGTGSDFADFLLGFPQGTSRRYGGSNVYLRSNAYSAYLIDDWRVFSRLTLNLGLRYEYAQPPTEKYDHLANLDMPKDISAVAVVLPGQNGPFTGEFPRSLVNPDRNNFAPRVGIAYRPRARSNLILRAGYGIFYNLNIYDQVFPQLAGQPPFAVSQSLLTSPGMLLTLHNGFPADPTTTVRNSFAVDRDYRIGYVQSWNLNIQKNIRRSLVMNLSYMGSKGTKLDMLRAPNRAPSGSQLTTEQRRRIDEAGNFTFETSGAASVYHALQLQMSRRFARGVSLMGNYTWSKSIDNAAGIGGGGRLVVQDDNNFRAERGLSSFDVRHRLNFNYMLELPFGPGRKFLATPGAAARLLSGWAFTGNAALSSGSPYTARILGNASNNSGTGGSQSERADATGQTVDLPASERTLTRWFNTAAFALPKAGVFGNAGRNTIIGPGSILFNMSATKDIQIDDNGRSLSFIWQVNNVFNKPNFTGLGTVVNASNFGRITGTQAMRSMNISLRFRF